MADFEVDLSEQFRAADSIGLHVDFRALNDVVDFDGWAPPEKLSGIGTAAFTTKNRAGIRFVTEESQDAELVLEAAWITPNPQRSPRLAARLNRQTVGSWTLEAGARVYRAKVPADMLRAGLNTLEITAPSRRDRDGGFGVAFTAIDLNPLQRESRRRFDDTARRLAADEPLDLFVRAPRHSTLTFDSLGPGAESVSVSVADAAGTNLATLPAGGPGHHTVRLPIEPDTVVRLRLRARSNVTIEHLRLTGNAPPRNDPPTVTSTTRPNVVLYVVDTLRADHLGCYGYAQPTSPNIDAVARDGRLFSNASAQSSWTRPATASILTGATPPRHGARTLRQPIAEDVPTLAQILKAAGYATAGFVTNFNVAPQWGFGRGFDRFKYFPENEASETVHVSAAEVNREVGRWIEGRDEKPFFLYVHASDPHAPYTSAPERAATFGFHGDRGALLAASQQLRAIQRNPRPADAEFVRNLTAAYDAEIASVDAAFGELIDELRRRGLYDDTVIVVTSDHGEEFFEHAGFEHGKTLYQEQLHIPLVVRLPDDGEVGRRDDRLARQIDIVPTLLDRIGIARPSSVEGRSLVGDGPTGAVTESLSETRLGRRRVRAIVADGHKVIHGADRKGVRTETFDLSVDPREQRDASRDLEVVTGYGLERMRSWSAPADTRAHPPVMIDDPATAERLRALGYDE